MAKKSRRARRQRTARSRRHPSSPAVAPPPTVEAVKPPVTRGDSSAVTSPAPRKQVDFGAEYHYVINDLRNMAVIAVAMLAVLVALSFVIR